MLLAPFQTGAAAVPTLTELSAVSALVTTWFSLVEVPAVICGRDVPPLSPTGSAAS